MKDLYTLSPAQQLVHRSIYKAHREHVLGDHHSNELGDLLLTNPISPLYCLCLSSSSQAADNSTYCGQSVACNICMTQLTFHIVTVHCSFFLCRLNSGIPEVWPECVQRACGH